MYIPIEVHGPSGIVVRFSNRMIQESVRSFDLCSSARGGEDCLVDVGIGARGFRAFRVFGMSLRRKREKG